MIEVTLPLLTIILVSILVLRLVKYFADNRNYYKHALEFPSMHPIWPSWISGWIVFPFNKFDLYQTLLQCQGTIAREEFGSSWLPCLIVTTAKIEHLQVLFQNSNLIDKSIHYQALALIAAGPTGLLHAGGETFKATKKVIIKCIAGSCQNIITDSFYRASEQLVNNLEKKFHEGGWFKLSHIAHEATTRATCWSAFDIDVTESIWNCVQHLHKDLVISGTNELLTMDFLAFKWSILEARVKNIQAKYIKAANDISQIKINQLREILSRNEEPPKQFVYNLLRERGDDLAAINTDIITVLLTALETTGTTISLTLTMLAMHPEMQEKVYEEDRRIQQELKGSKMTEKDFNRYEYLSRVVKETLRLVPPAYLFSRKATADIPFGKYTLPKDGTIFVFMPFIHRNPEYYPDPMKFDPDRFLPENAAKRSKFVYIPFSMGQRQCPGNYTLPKDGSIFVCVPFIHRNPEYYPDPMKFDPDRFFPEYVAKRSKYVYVQFSLGHRQCPGMQFGHRTVLFMVSSVIRKFKIFSSKYKTIEELDANLTGLVVLHDKDEFPTRLELRS